MRPVFPDTPIPDDPEKGKLRELLPGLDWAPTRGINRPCYATVISYGPDARHVKSEELRLMCDYEAKGYRDGRPACGLHLRAKEVVWCHSEPCDHGKAEWVA